MVVRLRRIEILFPTPYSPFPNVPMSSRFPPVDTADEDGLLAVGGMLTPDWLIDAYTHGIFPWPMNEDYPITWFSPDPRAILPLDEAHFSRRLLRTIRHKNWIYRIDTAFVDVIYGCAADREDEPGTWITSKMIDAYCEMHRLNFAHSFEVWEPSPDGESATPPKLIGGVYGLAFNRFFAGESMFHTVTDASKAALWFLVKTLKENGFLLFDLQVINDHTRQFGTIEIPRSEYLRRLKEALR